MTTNGKDVTEEADALLALSQERGGATADDHAQKLAGPSPSHPAAAGGTAKGHRGLAAGQVDRVVTAALPEGMHLSRDARAAFQKAASITLLYLACLADDERTQKLKGKKRSTLSVQDMHDALVAAGMAHLLPMMQTSSNKRGRA